MKVFHELAAWRAWRGDLGHADLGFVPTMGALHSGHAALVRRCAAECQASVVSILVNPTQFDDPADLAAYPQVQDADLELLRGLGVSAVLAPPATAIYPDQYRYRVSENELAQRFCGAHRSGHFDGVLTVVMRLLNLVRPRRAYFGEKDYQQLRLVQGMAEAFFMDVDIVPCATVREPSGLAMSSRNRRLDADQQRLAARLPRILLGADSPDVARDSLAAAGFAVDYVEDFEGRRLAAVHLGGVRLIDNVTIEGQGDD
jgi:pantoate--beta-alanine ligase